MRRAAGSAALLALAALAPAPAAAQPGSTVPGYVIDTYCANTLGPRRTAITLRVCRDREERAQRELVHIWTGVPIDRRRNCLQAVEYSSGGFEALRGCVTR